jgi:catechol 2,3-dioxygenase-like lactoylglutathione lyase family enzyme
VNSIAQSQITFLYYDDLAPIADFYANVLGLEPVLCTLVVDDVPDWYARLRERGVKILREPRVYDDIQVHCFFFEDPGGYAFEVQQFLKPELADIFHRAQAQ